MIRRAWRRVQPGEYVYEVGGMVAGGTVRHPISGLWDWYVEPRLAPRDGRTLVSAIGELRLDTAKAKVIRALGGAS